MKSGATVDSSTRQNTSDGGAGFDMTVIRTMENRQR